MRKLILFIVLASLMGCAHVVSEEMRRSLDAGVYVEALFQNPASYKGRLVMLGGVIASAKNAAEGTYIEVVEKPLDGRGRPMDSDISRGRFIVLEEGYLDTAIYSQGRDITVAGVVMGTTVRPLGDTDYEYLLIKSREMHLVKPRRAPSVTFGIGVLHTF